MPPREPNSSHQPEDSPPALKWKIASDLLVKLSAEECAQRGHRFQAIFQTLRPWMENAVNSLCQRHALLLDFSAISFAIVQGLVNASELSLKRSSKSEFLFQIYLESTALNACKAEQCTNMGNWNQFCFQLHQLDRDKRAFLLAALPPIARAQNKEVTPSIPDQKWLTLWTAITHNIEQDALPLEWQRYLEAPPTSVYAHSRSGPTIWIPSKNTNFEQELGIEFFKAYGCAAREQADQLNISLPKWLGDPSRNTSSERLDALIRKNGGLPSDRHLRSLIQSVLDAPREPEKQADIVSLLKACSDLGFSKFSVAIQQAMYLKETGEDYSSNLAIQRALNYAQSKANVSNALSTHASHSILDGNIDKAHGLLMEALRLSPWSPIALANLAYISKHFEGKLDSNEEKNHG